MNTPMSDLIESHTKPMEESYQYTGLGDFIVWNQLARKVIARVFIIESLSDDAPVDTGVIVVSSTRSGVKEHERELKLAEYKNKDDRPSFTDALWLMEIDDVLKVKNPPQIFEVSYKRFVRKDEDNVTVEITFEEALPLAAELI